MTLPPPLHVPLLPFYHYLLLLPPCTPPPVLPLPPSPPLQYPASKQCSASGEPQAHMSRASGWVLDAPHAPPLPYYYHLLLLFTTLPMRHILHVSMRPSTLPHPRLQPPARPCDPNDMRPCALPIQHDFPPPPPPPINHSLLLPSPPSCHTVGYVYNVFKWQVYTLAPLY